MYVNVLHEREIEIEIFKAGYIFIENETEIK